jgi:hypothetical protein
MSWESKADLRKRIRDLQESVTQAVEYGLELQRQHLHDQGALRELEGAQRRNGALVQHVERLESDLATSRERAAEQFQQTREFLNDLRELGWLGPETLDGAATKEVHRAAEMVRSYAALGKYEKRKNS